MNSSFTSLIFSKLSIIASIIFIVLIQSCKESKVPVLQVELQDDKDYSISEWKLIGPFLMNTPNWKKTGPFLKDSINGEIASVYDNMKYFGLEESSVNYEDLNSIKVLNSDSVFIMPEKFEHIFTNRHGMIDLSKKLNTNKPGNIYAACILKCKEEKDVVFLTGGDENAKFYINGKLIESPAHDPYRIVYQNYKFVHLKKGKNFLLLKLSNTIKSWSPNSDPCRFVINICSPKRYNDYYLRIEKRLIKKPVVPFGNPIILNNLVHPDDKIVRVEIRTLEDSVINCHDYADSIDPGVLKFGLYKLVLISKSSNYSQEFYYGDIHDGILQQKKKAISIINSSNDNAIKANLGALIHRYDTLINYFKKSNYFKIAEGYTEKELREVNTVIIKPTRLLKLNNPKVVSLEQIKLWRNPIVKIQFFKKSGSAYSSIPFIQTDSLKKLKRFNLKNESIIDSPGNNPFLKKLFFSFKKDTQPDYMLIITEDDLINRESDRRFIFLYKELYEINSRIEKKQEPFKHVPGTHLRGFISPIDESVQYYVINAPKSVKEDKSLKPLLVTVPWVYEVNYPFLRSFTVANIDAHERDSWQANRNDFIILNVNGRTYNQIITHPIAIQDILRNIEAVKQNYNIDTNRIHLFAYCGGSELATILATTYPSKFASVAIIEGLPLAPDNNWKRNNYSAFFTENLNNTPVHIIHGELDSHAPVDPIQDFVKFARKNGNTSIKLDIIPELTFEAYPRFLHEVDMFSFFSENSIEMPTEIQYSTAQHKYHKSYWIEMYPEISGQKATINVQTNKNTITANISKAEKLIINTRLAPIDTTTPLSVIINNEQHGYNPPYPEKLVVNFANLNKNVGLKKNKHTEGPLLHVFADRFVLVKSTIGTETENKSLNTILEKFIAMWKERYFVVPIVKNDIEISNKDINESSLLLFGNQHTNSIINKLYKDLPLRLENDFLQLGNKKYEGSSLGYCFLYPNPLNKNKYVVLIGSNNIEDMILREGNPARNGYFDYEIYHYDKKHQYLIEHGMFNEYWELSKNEQ